MDNKLLEELISNINKINSTQQFDYIHKCLELLKISVSKYELEEYNLLHKHELIEMHGKEVFVKKIIEETEKRLNDEQRDFFYDSIIPFFIIFTKDNKRKYNYYEKLSKEDYSYDTYSFAYVVASLDDDSIKVKYLNDDIGDYEYFIILKSISDDNLKIKYINESIITHSDYLFSTIASIKNDKLKITIFENYKDNIKIRKKLYYKLLASLNDDELKIQEIKKLDAKRDELFIEMLIFGLNNLKSLIKVWDIIDIDYKDILLYKMADSNLVFEYIKKLNDEIELDNNQKYNYIHNKNNNTFYKENYSELDFEYIKKLNGEIGLDAKHNYNYIKDIIFNLEIYQIEYILLNCLNIEMSAFDIESLLKKINDDDSILRILEVRPDNILSRLVRRSRMISPEILLSNIDSFMKREKVDNIEKAKKLINKLFITNNDIIYTITWDLLDDKYIDTLGLDKINLIGSFDEITKWVLELDDKSYEAFYRCLNHYIDKMGDRNWQNAAYSIMLNIESYIDNKTDFIKYIVNYNDINMDCLLYLLLNGSELKIESVDDINNYLNNLEFKCDKDITDDNLDKKRNAICIKYFGIGSHNNFVRFDKVTHNMHSLYNLYSKDIDLIENEELKKLFKFIIDVFECDDGKKLEEIYNSNDKFRYIDLFKLEEWLKSEFLKLYLKELVQVSNLKKNDDGLYEAGIEFSMIVTSVGAFVKNTPDNYMNDWNRPSLLSNHFCASYIRNDMLGTAPINNVVYGFSTMDSYSLLLSGTEDISSSSEFVSAAYDWERYVGPDNQINLTSYNRNYRFNEMDFRRIQNGKKKSPDYIVVFKRQGNIENLDKSRKASDDWGGLPIVVIDVDLCLKNEKDKLDNMLKEYYTNPSLQLYELIKAKVMNNRVTDTSFASDVNLDELIKLCANSIDTINNVKK